MGLIEHYFILMTGVTGRLALCVYGADRAPLYTGFTGRLALCVYRADWALLYTDDWCHGSPGTLYVRG